MSDKSRAVLVRPSAPDQHPSIGDCVAYLEEQGFDLVALADLAGALAMLASNEVEVVVVAEERDLYPLIRIVLPHRDRPRVLPRPDR